MGVSACADIEPRSLAPTPRVAQLCAAPLADAATQSPAWRSSLIRWDAEYRYTWVTAARCEPPVAWMGRTEPQDAAAHGAAEIGERSDPVSVRHPVWTVAPLGPPRPVRPPSPEAP